MKTAPNLNTLSKEVFEANKAKGFHDKEYSDETLLMLVITELSEAIEADRKDKRAKTKELTEHLKYQNAKKEDRWWIEWYPHWYDTFIKGSIEEELADTVIRLLDLAGLRNAEITINNGFIGDTKELIFRDKSFPELVFWITRRIISLKIYVSRINNLVSIVLMSIIALCEHLNIDLWHHVELKLQYNKTRPDKHGKKY
jgi:hypothetical protein